MLREFDARLEKGDNPGAWTCVVMDDAVALFGTRGLVKIRGAIDGEPFDGALMAQGDGTHRLPVKAKLRKAIGKEAGDTVHVRASTSGPRNLGPDKSADDELHLPTPRAWTSCWWRRAGKFSPRASRSCPATRP